MHVYIRVLPQPTPVGRDGAATTFAAVTTIALVTAALMNFVIFGRRLELKISIYSSSRGA